jgi:hypothetical protein
MKEGDRETEREKIGIGRGKDERVGKKRKR